MPEYNNIITNIENSMVGQLARAGACESKKGLTWQTLLKEEKEKPYFQAILKFIEHERSLGKVIYPKNSDIFNALALTPFEDLKVVILGQDPYHGPNQAHGLSFSVMPNVPFPPSLRNIFKELNSDIGCDIPKSGYLVNWAKQGVLLLNTVLSVEAGKPESHKGVGWQQFTDKIIKLVNEYKNDVVFILWGSHAQQKIEFIDQNKHFIIKSVHPSPLSATRGFFGSKPFSKTNNYLKEKNLNEIAWDIK